jgi:hypothetical protein
LKALLAYDFARDTHPVGAAQPLSAEATGREFSSVAVGALRLVSEVDGAMWAPTASNALKELPYCAGRQSCYTDAISGLKTVG